MSEKPKNGAERKDAPRRKYSTPVVRTYGAIRVITENVGSMGNTDNGSAPKVKTR
jgi:hypothetical protein